jgi:hypothetical protein
VLAWAAAELHEPADAVVRLEPVRPSHGTDGQGTSPMPIEPRIPVAID